MKKLGFFEDEEKKDTKKIDVEVDLQRYLQFKGALAVLDQKEAEAFDNFVSYTLTRANRVLAGENQDDFDNESSHDKLDANHLSEEVIKNRIYKWAKNERGYPHLMVKAYFMSESDDNNGQVFRLTMQNYFGKLIDCDNREEKFLSVFRQMCSDSSRAYGNLFIYNSAREIVYLNDKYKDLLYSLRNKF